MEDRSIYRATLRLDGVDDELAAKIDNNEVWKVAFEACWEDQGIEEQYGNLIVGMLLTEKKEVLLLYLKPQ